MCKLKKWAEIGRDLGYSGKIMSSLSTSLKNSYQKWLFPYEEYLRIAKPGVHQQLELEYGGPLTPSPAPSPMKRSSVNTPSSLRAESPARHATDALQATMNGHVKDSDKDTAMTDASPLAAPPTTGFRAINSGGFTSVNSGFSAVNRALVTPSEGNAPTPTKGFATTPLSSAKNTPEYRPSSLGPAALKRQLSCDSLDSAKKDSSTEKDDTDAGSRRSKRLKKGWSHHCIPFFLPEFHRTVFGGDLASELLVVQSPTCPLVAFLSPPPPAPQKNCPPMATRVPATRVLAHSSLDHF